MLDLRTEFSELIAEGFDVAIRLGPLPTSGMIAVRISSMERVLCATPAYLERHGLPASPAELARHRVVEMPGVDGRGRSWAFERKGVTERVDVTARVSVNEVLTIHRLVANGVGLGVLTGYICVPLIEAGRLVRVLIGFIHWAREKLIWRSSLRAALERSAPRYWHICGARISKSAR